MLGLEDGGGGIFQIRRVEIVSTVVGQSFSEDILEMNFDPHPSSLRISGGQFVTALVDHPNLQLSVFCRHLEVAGRLEHVDVAVLGDDDLSRIHVGGGIP